MANQADLTQYNDSTIDPALNQAILQNNYQSYVASGGNPNNYSIGSNMVVSAGAGGSGNSAAGLLGAYGGGYGTSGYAPYDVGGGKTKWDEFVQQMQLEQDKLKQAQDIETARLSQEKQLEEERLAQEQKIADQNTVEAYNKNLSDQSGPKDPYGYLFSSRGLAAPQGYAPTPLPLPQAVQDSYKNQGIDLATAQQQVTGSSGPSFIDGYLGGMPKPLQQGPMGFQNTPDFKNVAPGSQPQPPAPTPPSTPSNNPSPPSGQAPTPPGFASGGVVPGYAPGNDTVPAMLSPGEGVLKPQAVQAMGGPTAVNQINSQFPQNWMQGPEDQDVQKFATGGMVQPLFQQQLTDLGNGLFQRGAETGTIRNPQAYTAGFDGANTGIPVRSAAGASNSVGQLGFGANTGFNITGPAVQGTNNFAPNDVNGSTQWYPVTLANGSTGYVSAYDLQPNGFQMPATGNAQSLNPSLPQGFQLQNPGIATRSEQAPQPQLAPPVGSTPQRTDIQRADNQGMLPPDWLAQTEQYFGTSSQGPQIEGQNAVLPQSAPIGTLPTEPQAPAPQGGSAGSPVLLTGGILNPTGPVNGPPMNLNDLDPYTRSMVDMYGRPQIPSAQALANMPSSGQQAYQNYVEKVAGGNFQDLLDQSRMLNPSGISPGDLRFT